jgi:hypothetical protein
MASGVSLLVSRIALAMLHQSYDFECDGLDSDTPKKIQPLT